MRFPIKIILLSLFITLVIFTGCSKEDEYIPGLIGNMVGYVYIYDEYGYPFDDHSRVKITAFGLDGKYIVYSNSDGRFEFYDLPAGTYELHFEKRGFGTLKQFGIQHLGGKPTILFHGYTGYYIHAYIIYEMTTTEIVNVEIENDTLSAEFAFKEPPYPDVMWLRIFFSNDPDLNRQTAQFIDNYNLSGENGKYSRIIYHYDMNFQPGETVFFKASIYTQCTTLDHFNPQFSNYSISKTDTYFDYQSNEIIYPNSGDESETYSFIFPE